MGRRRRRIESLKCYEVCFRAKEGLPFVCYHSINLIICSVVARVQRDHKVVLCHDIWNGSHSHLILMALDATQFFRFLGEVQKQITESIKRLLGISHLSIWEGTPTVALILDLDKAIDRIAYFYANPAQDNLVDVIEKFPGISSWKDFQKNTTSLTAKSSESFPWLRLPSIPKLPEPFLSQEEDLALMKALKKGNKERHELIRQPNKWMECFGIKTDQEVMAINKRIVEELRRKEQVARDIRKAEGKSVLGVARLTSQEIMKPHTPKKRSRKIFCLSSDPRLRLEFILEFNAFCDKCSECFQRWKMGDYRCVWPLGAFKPPLPPPHNIYPLVEHI